MSNHLNACRGDFGVNFQWDEMYKMLDWLPGGWINDAHELIDRHANGRRRDKTAMIWEGINRECETYTFGQMKRLTNKFANVLKSVGVGKQDRIVIFMDRIPEFYIAFLGTLKIGAIAIPLHATSNHDFLKNSLKDSKAKVMISQTYLRHGVSLIIPELFDLQHIIVVNRDNNDYELVDIADLNYETEMTKASANYDVMPMSQYDYSILHYTFDETGNFKGLAYSHEAVAQHCFNGHQILGFKEDDIYWCTSDPSYVTGIGCGILTPWSNGLTQFIYEGGFDINIWCDLIEKHKISVWCTATSAIRMLITSVDDVVTKYDLSSLKNISVVDGTLNIDELKESQRILGKVPCHSWSQPETGAVLIAHHGGNDINPGSVGCPLHGMEIDIVDDQYNVVEVGSVGNLAIRPEWPAMFQTYWNDSNLYNSRFRKGWYISDEKAFIDDNGYVWLVSSS